MTDEQSISLKLEIITDRIRQLADIAFSKYELTGPQSSGSASWLRRMNLCSRCRISTIPGLNREVPMSPVDRR